MNTVREFGYPEPDEGPTSPPDAITRFAIELRDTKNPEITSHTLSGNGTTHKCQKGWFTCVSGLAQTVIHQGHFQSRGLPVPTELTQFIQKYTANGHAGTIDREDIDFGDRVLNIIIEAMQRFESDN